MNRFSPALAAALVVVAGCSAPVTTGPAPQPSTTASAAVTSGGMQIPAISGSVVAPTSMVAAGGLNLVTTGGGNLVTTGGGNILSHNGGLYRTLALAQAPLAGVEVTAIDMAGNRLGGADVVRTDAQGRFKIGGVPASGNYMVVAAAQTAGGKPVKLLTMAQWGEDAQVSAGSTCVAEAMLSQLTGPFGTLDMASYRQAAADVDGALEAGETPDWGDRAAVAAYTLRLAEEVAALKPRMAALVMQMQRRAAPSEAPAATPTPAATATPIPAATPTPAAATATPAAPAKTLTDVVVRGGLRDSFIAEGAMVITLVSRPGSGFADNAETPADDATLADEFELAFSALAVPARFDVYAAAGSAAEASRVRASGANVIGQIVVTDLGEVDFHATAGTRLYLRNPRLEQQAR